ncbi:unnamed protein product [Parnassius apollo]|uniref:(apollo) hypothetical protein n=1 Tax=Parnassius apollo TaxID=110799 RepID=A0A8S3XPE4_PARAO|nr:unnamed protein product [Parnassius apollo]
MEFEDAEKNPVALKSVFPQSLMDSLAVDSESEDEESETEEMSEETLRSILADDNESADEQEEDETEANPEDFNRSNDFGTFTDREETYTERAGPIIQQTKYLAKYGINLLWKR